MQIIEKHLEDFACDVIQKGQAPERGLMIKNDYNHMVRQMGLGGYGVADIVTFKRIKRNAELCNNDKIEVTIVELKKGNIDLSHASQLMRYCAGVKEYLKEIIKIGDNFEVVINPILIGNGLEVKNDYFLLSECKSLQIYNYRISHESGIHFNKEFDSNLSIFNNWIDQKEVDNITSKLLL